MSWACDLDGPSVYQEQEVTARKEHKCVECFAPILPGERHLAFRGLWDGQWSGGRQHLLCRDACVWIRDAIQNDECIPFGALHDWWGEHRSFTDALPWSWHQSRDGAEKARIERLVRANWLIGARMYAMIRQRQRLARLPPSTHRQETRP